MESRIMQGKLDAGAPMAAYCGYYRLRTEVALSSNEVRSQSGGKLPQRHRRER
jgi:hypothetical protein